MTEPRFPVSVKGVIAIAGEILLLKNERDEWELPGGRLEAGESLRECLAREIAEETGLAVAIADLIDTRLFEVIAGKSVLIVTYRCRAEDWRGLRISSEHKEIGRFAVAGLNSLALPELYKEIIRTALPQG